jgi:hypothetical protein
MISTVDLFVLTSLGHLLYKLNILFSFYTKQATLMRRSSVLSLPPVSIPWLGHRDISHFSLQTLQQELGEGREPLLKGKTQYC